MILEMKFFQKIIVEDIYYLKAIERKTLMVSTNGRQSILGISLSWFEKVTEANNQFVRVNKQYIINRNFIERIDSKKIIMQNGMTLLNTNGLTSHI
ncbi:hypothetical protein GCM10027035_23230 [Emticicia sediminis]